MILSNDAQKSLTAVVAAGVARCAQKLGDATHDPWRVAEVTLSLEQAGPFAAVFDGVVNDHYGSFLTFPGGSLVVLFAGKSGYLVTNAFTRDIQDRVEGLNQREASTLGEIANIVLNPLVGHLAKAWGISLVVSAPSTRIASRRDHLTKALEPYGVGGRDGDRLAATFFVRLACDELFSEGQILLFLDQDLVAKIAGSAAA
jgi:hypothetical protein